MTVSNELYSLLIPLRNERLLVPRMCVAEVIAFADTDRRQDDDAPDWLLGTIEWNGRRVPVVSLDGDVAGHSQPAGGKRGSRSRIVIFHSISGEVKGGYYGILTQGFPQLVRVNRDVLSTDDESPPAEDEPMLCRVRMIHEYPLIPDLEEVERRIAGLEDAA